MSYDPTQDMQVAWTPPNVKLGELLGFYTYDDIPGIASLSFLAASSCAGWDIEKTTTITNISWPNLVTIDPGQLYLDSNTGLVSVSAPKLITIAGDFQLTYNPSLTTVTFPLLLPGNGKTISFAGCALNQQSVDHILARAVANAAFVSGTLDFRGGTNAVPSSTEGGSDYAVLTARGVLIKTN